uniref:Aegyptin/gSG7 salivary protein-like four-helix bundle domain-containing protein n=1 Tax=Anopheles minimus TaxID=112268 RepID=A0A182W8S7_9DIPT
MKFLLLLTSVLCLALIVSARPADETDDQDTSTELSEADDTQEGETSEPDAESGADNAETGSEDGELESSPGEEHTDDTVSDGDEETSGTNDEDAEGHGAGTEGEAGEEGTEEEQAGEDGAEKEQTGEEGAEENQGGAEGGEESRSNTYHQVHELLKNIMQVGTKDNYLKSFVLARLQERLMNPTIDLVGTIEKYSKIKECFSGLAKDVGELVKKSEESYAECKKDKNNPHCGFEGTRDLDDGLIEREQELSNCIVDKRDAQ